MYRYGFQRPSDPETPEIPENLVVTPGSNGYHFADWDDSRRAETYRAVIKNAAGDTIAERIVSESEATFQDLPRRPPHRHRHHPQRRRRRKPTRRPRGFHRRLTPAPVHTKIPS